MIKTKYVVGDVVVFEGKQRVIICVDALSTSLYKDSLIAYRFSNGDWYTQDELDADSIN